MTYIPLLNLIGCGRAAGTLAYLWHQTGCLRIQQVLTRSVSSAEAACAFIGAGAPVSLYEDMAAADYWLVGVQDRAIDEAGRRLVSCPVLRRGDGVFHLSGFTASSIFAPLAARGVRCASVHPVLSFASPATAIEQFPGTLCGIEGEETLCAELQDLFGKIGGQCFAIDAAHKPLYHAGSVFASNFLVVIEDLARKAYLRAGLSEEMAGRLMAQLAQKSLDNVLAHGGAAAITGPAARGDVELVDAQRAAVVDHDLLAGQAYEVLSQLAARLAGSGEA